jgi:hypothetical protein
MRAAAAAIVLTAAALRAPGPVSAQSSRVGGDIRVVETVDPVSGVRYRQAVYDLTRNEIKAVQRALREAGYLGVGWTGRLDHGTVEALRELQENRGLYPCGCVSYETIVALGLEPDVQVMTVAGGASSSDAFGPDGPYRAGYGSGLLYPVGVPVYVPVDPADPGAPAGEGPASGARAAPAYPPPGAVPPGIRPLPPPTRVIPAGPRSGSVPISTP